LARPAELEPAALGVSEPGVWPSVWKAFALLVLMVASALVLERTSHGVLNAVTPSLRGAVIMIVAGGAMTAAGLPRSIQAFSGGFVFGAPVGAAISLLGQLLGCAADYLAARELASGLIGRAVARPGGKRLRAFLAAHPFTATLTLRLLPVGNNVLLNLLAGASRLDAKAFFAASAIGYIPQTIVFALLGSGAHLGRGIQLALVGMLFAAASALGVWLYRRTSRNVDAQA
jgi:uncharacterized membrane protein YdjX (TVP38/TMEM64 family)